MTGGVSLAVWMGGVTREIDLLTQASNARRAAPPQVQGNDPAANAPLPSNPTVRDLYQRLVNKLDVLVDVDTLSGTSAGGLNAVFLAYARCRNGDLGPLRQIWLDIGGLENLLREPTDSDIPSLLYGDAYMFSELNQKLPLLGPNPAADPPSTRLFVTTTLLTPESSRFTDAMGTLVQDTDKRGLFNFDDEVLSRDGIETALALAARSSASYPGAFEPAFVPADDYVSGPKGVPTRPPMAEFSNITRSHWVADGGILDNRPLDVLLERVFERPARREVRRVLLYVVPSPGPAPDLMAAIPDDDHTKPYGLLASLMHDLSSAMSQSIASDLRAIDRHNQEVEGRADLRLQLTVLADRLPKDQGVAGRLLSNDLLASYCASESEKQARVLLSEAFRLLSTWPPQTPQKPEGVPEQWRSQLVAGSDVERKSRQEAASTLAGIWRPASDQTPDALPESTDAFALYGRAAYDNAKSIALSVLHLAYDAATDKPKADIRAQLQPLHAALADYVLPNPDEIVKRKLTDEVKPSVAGNAPPALMDVARSLATRWAAATTCTADNWTNLSAALVQVGKALGTVNVDPGSELACYQRYLGLTDTAVVASRLFDLAVCELALLPPDVGPYQRVELVQVSADTRTMLAPKYATAASKLTGLQFHHFGAFYKASWRANDWMWGRLDGAGWLVHALLDPRRLIAVAAKLPKAARVEWAMDLFKSFAPEDLPDGDAKDEADPTYASVRHELAFLGDEKLPVPQGIPRTSLWLASAWQKAIAEEEMLMLAECVLGTDGKPADSSPAESREWAREVKAKKYGAPKLLDKCPVPRETFASDAGTPLMLRTITKAAATATGAVASVSALPGPVKPAVTSVRTLALGGYRVTRAVGGAWRYLVLVGLGLLVVGIALATQSSDLFGITGLSLTAVGAYCVTVGAWQLTKRLLPALLSVTVVLAVASLATRWVRRRLFATDDPKHLGYVARQLKWLQSTWWHPLLVVGIFLLIIAVVAAASSGIWGKRKLKAADSPTAVASDKPASAETLAEADKAAVLKLSDVLDTAETRPAVSVPAEVARRALTALERSSSDRGDPDPLADVKAQLLAADLDGSGQALIELDHQHIAALRAYKAAADAPEKAAG
jgi:patatin-related protein